MKAHRFMSFLLICTLFAGVSCEKNPDDNSGKTPVVSISVDKQYDENNKASVKLALSDAAKTDVVVKLAKADVQSGYTALPANYNKSVTIKAGEKEAIVAVEADVFGLSSGQYQTAIGIESATGAEVGTNKTAYLNLDFYWQPAVNMYADNMFASSKTAEVKLVLAEAATKDVTVTLEEGEGTEASIQFEKNVVIPAGETEKAVTVTVTIPDDLAAGKYPAVIKIASIQNAVAGDVTSVTINLVYPFSAAIVVDGDFSDWADAPCTCYTLCDNAYYTQLKTLKLAASGKYLYAYAEFAGPVNTIYNVFIDSDGNPATGAIVTAMDNNTWFAPFKAEDMGIDWYIGDAYFCFVDDANVASYTMLYPNYIGKYNGNDKESIFSSLDSRTGTVDGEIEFAAASDLGNGICGIEMQFKRSYFDITGDKAGFCLKLMDNGWNATGILPQLPQSEQADANNVIAMRHGQAKMATINLPAYEQ